MVWPLVLVWVLTTLGACARETPEDLVRALAHPATAERAIDGLVAHGNDVIPLLLAVVVSPDLGIPPPQRAGAFEALARIGKPALAPLRNAQKEFAMAEQKVRKKYSQMALLDQEGTPEDLEIESVLERIWAIQRDLERTIERIEKASPN